MRLHYYKYRKKIKMALLKNNTIIYGNVTISATNITSSALSVNSPSGLNVANQIYTDSSTFPSGTVTHGAGNALGVPTIAASNTSVTYANASTLYIASAPVAGTNVTITNQYAIYVANGQIFVNGTISDSIGNVRTIVQNSQSGSSSYTLVLLDAGKHIYITGIGGVTCPVSVFSPGQAITVVNNTSASVTITAPSGGTMYLAGTATTGNRTLAQRGIATLLYVVGGATPTVIASGAGLT
jgi:hypothetical protein